MKDKIEELSKEFSLNDRIKDPISSYSHGMMQKISLISALLHSPKLLVLDEPFVGLDPKATFELKEILKKKCKEEGLMVFFSSHVLDVVEKFCNKIAIIKIIIISIIIFSYFIIIIITKDVISIIFIIISMYSIFFILFFINFISSNCW